MLYGIKARFYREPKRKAFADTKSYDQHIEFVHTDILKHVEDGSLDVVTRKFAKIINPIKVEEGKKLRLCVDTRYPNSFLAAPKFKNETIEVVLEQIVD